MIKYSLSEKLKLSLEKILKICLWPKYCPQVLPWIVETAGSYNYRRPDQDRTISNHDSNHCDIFTDCVHHSKCPHYLEQTEKLKTVALDTSEYKRIRGELRQLICNQKERKVCCEPSTFSSNSGRPSPRPSAGNWSGWTVCTVSCGGGTQERRRSDGQIQMQRCNSNPCLNSGKVVE